MMFLMKLLLDSLLKNETPQRFLVLRYLGGVLLFLAGGGGVFFLFQLLTPLVGYFESGAIVCAIVASMGLILLYCGQEQKQRLPMEGLFNQAQEVLKKTEVSLDEMVTNNTSKILLGAFITGVTLSQMKNLGTRK